MTRAITIVGGGIAGLSLGIALRKRGVPVSLFEKRCYPQHRVCGEFLCGVGPETIRCLGIESLLGDAAEIRSVRWFLGEQMVLDIALPQQALGISRYALDARLAGQFESLGGSLHTGTVYRGEDLEGTVWATGKHAVRRRNRWIGLSCHFGDLPLGVLEMRSAPGGYFGMSPVEGGKTNLTGLFSITPGVKGRGIDLLMNYLRSIGLDRFAGRLEASGPIESSFVTVAGFDFGRQSARGRFTLGDASLMIPPFAGNGMSMALEAAAYAVGGLTGYAEGRLSWEAAATSQEQYRAAAFRKRMVWAARLQPLLVSKRGLRALEFFAIRGLLPVGFLFRSLR